MAKFDVSSIQAGDHLVLVSFCLTGNLDGSISQGTRLRSILTDEFGQPLISNQPAEKEFEMKNSSIVIKAQFMKTDAGSWGPSPKPKADEL